MRKVFFSIALGIAIFDLNAGLLFAAEAGVKREPLMIADFEEDGVIGRIQNKAVTLALTEKDAVSGKRSLEARIAPFSVHKYQWPGLHFLPPKFFTTPLDLSGYSKISVMVRNMTGNPGKLFIQVSSLPYNDGGRNFDGSGTFEIIGGTTMVCEMPVTAIQQNDLSSIKYLIIGFPPSEVEVVYRIDAIQAVYDPAIGSKTDELKADIKRLTQQFSRLRKTVNWKAIPPDARPHWEKEYTRLKGMVESLSGNYAPSAAGEPFQGKNTAVKQQVDEASGMIGGFLFADKKDFVAWEIDPYLTISRTTAPDLWNNQLLDKVAVEMAQNEFRDSVFMVSPCAQDVKLEVRVEAPDALPKGAISVEETLYLPKKDSAGQEGNAVYRLEGPLAVPKGESRPVTLRFDTRHTSVKPGRYAFKVALRDLNTGAAQTIPGTLEVFDFQLPSYDVLANQSYAEFQDPCEFSSGDLLAKAVAHMKMYGLNRVIIHSLDMPKAALDAGGTPVRFDTTRFEDRLRQIQKAWQAAPGNENLKFILCLSPIAHIYLDKQFPPDKREAAISLWYKCVKDTTSKLGIPGRDLIFVMCDEPSEEAQNTVDIPMAEAIKKIDPDARFTSNASFVNSDLAMRERFLKCFDILEPRMLYLKLNPSLVDWLQKSGKTLGAYDCTGAYKGKNIYDYYRVYAWYLVKYGFTGTGLWTYCGRNSMGKVWENPGEDFLMILKHPDKDEVVHFRRYEFFREGADDYRYVAKLREAAGKKGTRARDDAEKLIRKAAADITSNVSDTALCEKWRLRIAREILKVQ